MLEGYAGEYSDYDSEQGGQPGWFYRVLCDGCGDDLSDYPGSEASGWDDPQYAAEQSDADTTVDPDVHLCRKCGPPFVAAYSEVEWVMLTEPLTAPQGAMALIAARGWIRRNLPVTTTTEASDVDA